MPRSKPSLGAIFLTIFLDLLGFGLVVPFLAVQAREHFGVSEGVAALLGTIYSLMQFLCMPLWGRLSDRIGRRPVLLMTVAASALMMFALGSTLGFTTSIVWVFVARGLGGAATASIGTASAYIADITQPSERARGMALIGIGFGLGFIVGPAVGGLLSGFEINGRSGVVACYVAGSLSVINLGWIYLGLPESLPPERRSARGRSLSPLNREALRATFGNPVLAPAILINFLMVLAFSLMEQTYPFMAQDAFGLDERGIGMLFMFMGIVAALTQGGLVRRLSGRVPESSMIRGGVALQGLAFTGLLLSPSVGSALLWGASAALAIGNGMAQPNMAAYVSRHADPSRQGEALSTNQSMSAMGRVLGPGIGGALYQSVSMQAPFALGAVLNVLLAVGLGRRLVRGNPAGDTRSGEP